MINIAEIAVFSGHVLFIAHLLIYFECLFEHLFSVIEVATDSVNDAEIAVSFCDAIRPFQFFLDFQNLPVHLFSPVEVAADLVNVAEIAECSGLFFGAVSYLQRPE